MRDSMSIRPSLSWRANPEGSSHLDRDTKQKQPFLTPPRSSRSARTARTIQNKTQTNQKSGPIDSPDRGRPSRPGTGKGAMAKSQGRLDEVRGAEAGAAEARNGGPVHQGGCSWDAAGAGGGCVHLGKGNKNSGSPVGSKGRTTRAKQNFLLRFFFFE